MEFNKRLPSVPHVVGERLQMEKDSAEETLLKMLEIQSTLESALVLPDKDEAEMQTKYIQLHTELANLRQRNSVLSSEKVGKCK